MRASVVMAGLVALASARRGDAQPPAPELNLLTAAPTVVAVSSTVANRAILPAHLVDGDLGTAWNSRTGELVRAWLGARVPATAHVARIRMTVGFTRRDPKLGDLFTMNPRIRKVRVLRDGTAIAEHTFDPELRTLQDIAIDQPGGDYRIEITDVQPGSKPAWREICVSELEVWGTLPAGTAATPSVPVVRVGGFDSPPAFSKADCVAAMFPDAHGDRIATAQGDEAIGLVEAIVLSPALAVCRVDHTRERTERWNIGVDDEAVVTLADTTTEIAPVTRVLALSAGAVLERVINSEILNIEFPPSGQGVGDIDYVARTVALSTFPLTASEAAVLIAVTEHRWGAQLENTTEVSTLYRADQGELASVLTFTASSGRFDGTTVHQLCKLIPPARGAVGKPPPTLSVACESTELAPGKPDVSHTRTQRYRWTGAAYEPR